MLTTADFMLAAKWAGIIAILCGAIATLGFIFKWGVRFRLVGIASFMVVVTAGLFALGLVPIMRVQIPGAAPYTLVYDTGMTQSVIAVAPEITESELKATLRQAASNLYSLGRTGRGENRYTIRARTIIHPQPNVSQPVYLGYINHSLAEREDKDLEIVIDTEKLAIVHQVKGE